MRRTGRTTRLANDVIDMLFRNGEVVFRDHYGTNQSNIELMKIIDNRLTLEHHMIREMDYKVKFKLSENLIQINIKKESWN